jgi:hypothetical protein
MTMGGKRVEKKQQQQIPFGDDNKKSNSGDRTGGTYSSEKTRQTRTGSEPERMAAIRRFMVVRVSLGCGISYGERLGGKANFSAPLLTNA